MGSLTARGRIAVVLAFLASAALATGAAIFLVNVSDEERTPGTTLPKVHPTLIAPSSAAPSESPAAVATASPTASPSAAATASPGTTARPVTSSSPRPAATSSSRKYLEARASLEPVSRTTYRLEVRAVDGNDSVVLTSVTWGDGSTTARPSGASCSAPAGGDCQVFTLNHTYSAAGTYPIEVHVTAGKESVRLSLQAT